MMWWVLLVIILLFCAMALTGAPYVPSHRRDVQQALTKLYRLGPEDCLVDMGSGDGVVLKIARQQGARAFGVELNPLLVLLSRWRLRGDAKAMVVCGNLYARIFHPAPQWSIPLATRAISLGWPPMCSSKPPALVQTYGLSPTPLPCLAGHQCANKARISCIGCEQSGTNSIPLLSIAPGISIIGV